MKNFFKKILVLSLITSTIFSTSTIYSNAYINNTNIVDRFYVEKYGENVEVIINSNREVFVDGRNITTIIKHERPYSVRSRNGEWMLAGINEYYYDLAGISVMGAQKILAKLGISAAASTFKQALNAIGVSSGASTFLSTGLYIKDTRTIYYRNISKPGRPDIKEKHKFYFVAEMSNIGKYEKYLGNL